jgi:hypothetical protein
MVTDERKKPAIWMARGRCVIGLAGLFTPGLVGAVMAGSPKSASSKAMTRFFGARELIVGLGTMIAIESSDGGANWLSLAAVVDGLDAVISLASPGLPKRSRLVGLAAAGLAVTQMQMAKELAVLENPDARV